MYSPVHSSCRYAVVASSGDDYDIYAVHGLDSIHHVLASRVTIMTGGALAYHAPQVIQRSRIMLMAANYKNAAALRREFAEQDDEEPRP